MKRVFFPCSGQSGAGLLTKKSRKNDWGIHRIDGPSWWRAENKAGRMRTFPDYKSAEKAALKMERKRKPTD